MKSLWLTIFFFTKAFSDFSAMLGKNSMDIALGASCADLRWFALMQDAGWEYDRSYDHIYVQQYVEWHENKRMPINKLFLYQLYYKMNFVTFFNKSTERAEKYQDDNAATLKPKNKLSIKNL